MATRFVHFAPFLINSRDDVHPVIECLSFPNRIFRRFFFRPPSNKSLTRWFADGRCWCSLTIWLARLCARPMLEHVCRRIRSTLSVFFYVVVVVVCQWPFYDIRRWYIVSEWRSDSRAIPEKRTKRNYGYIYLKKWAKRNSLSIWKQSERIRTWYQLKSRSSAPISLWLLSFAPPRRRFFFPPSLLLLLLFAGLLFSRHLEELSR